MRLSILDEYEEFKQIRYEQFENRLDDYNTNIAYLIAEHYITVDDLDTKSISKLNEIWTYTVLGKQIANRKIDNKNDNMD